MPIHEAAIIWREVAPVFMFYEKIQKNRKKYWTIIEKLCIKLCNEQPPDALHQFPLFVQYLYKYRHIIYPKSLNQCTKLLQITKYKKSQWFITLKLPLIINDPLLYIKLLIQWRNEKNEIWNTIIADDAFSLLLIHRNLNLITESYSNSRYASKINNLTLDLVMTLILEIANHRQIDDICEEFIEFACVVFSANKNLTFGASIIRCLAEILKFMKKKTDLFKELASKLIQSTSKTPLFSMTSFLLQKYKQFVDVRDLIVSVGTFCSIEEIEFIEAWMIGPASFTAALKLLETAYDGPIFNAISIHVLCNLLKLYSYSKLRSYIIGFIRRTFLFIVRSSFHNRNKLQIASICYNFKNLSKAAPYLKPYIASFAGSLVKTGTCPDNLFNFIKPGYPNKNLTIRIRNMIRLQRRKNRSKVQRYSSINKKIPKKIVRLRSAKKTIAL